MSSLRAVDIDCPRTSSPIQPASFNSNSDPESDLEVGRIQPEGGLEVSRQLCFQVNATAFSIIDFKL